MALAQPAARLGFTRGGAGRARGPHGLGRDTHRLITGASVAGPLHLRDGIVCQDRAAWCGPAIAVADGLGSARRSHIGAWIAVTSAVEAGVEGASASGMAHAARTALSACEGPLGELACTLIAIVIRPDGIHVAHVGDGAVVGERDGEPIMLSGPGDSEYANEVDPLTADGWLGTLRVSGPFAGLTAVAAFTDGCQRAALRGGVPHPGFFGPLFAWARNGAARDDELAGLLSGPKLSEHSEDDKTLVLAVLP